MKTIWNKLGEKRTWIAIAAFCASIGASIAGLAIDNTVVTSVGIACTVISGGIYAACNAYGKDENDGEENQ